METWQFGYGFRQLVLKQYGYFFFRSKLLNIVKIIFLEVIESQILIRLILIPKLIAST